MGIDHDEYPGASSGLTFWRSFGRCNRHKPLLLTLGAQAVEPLGKGLKLQDRFVTANWYILIETRWGQSWANGLIFPQLSNPDDISDRRGQVNPL